MGRKRRSEEVEEFGRKGRCGVTEGGSSVTPSLCMRLNYNRCSRLHLEALLTVPGPTCALQSMRQK